MDRLNRHKNKETRQPRLLAFDLGKHCGYAANEPNGAFCDTRILTDEFDALTFFRTAIQEFEPDAVMYEEVHRHMGTEAAHRYGGYLALLRAAAQQKGVMVFGVGVGVIKAHARCGEYIPVKASKKAATVRNSVGKTIKIPGSKLPVWCAAVAKGYDPTDDNAADAAIMLDYALVNNLVEVGE